MDRNNCSDVDVDCLSGNFERQSVGASTIYFRTVEHVDFQCKI